MRECGQCLVCALLASSVVHGGVPGDIDIFIPKKPKRRHRSSSIFSDIRGGNVNKQESSKVMRECGLACFEKVVERSWPPQAASSVVHGGVHGDIDIFFVIKPVTVVLIEEIIKANDSVKKVMIRKRGSPTTHSSLCAIGWGEDRLYIYTRQAQDSESMIVVVVMVGAKCSAWQISHTLMHNSLW
jgi:hypothetical protein